MISILYKAFCPWILAIWVPLSLYLIFGFDVKSKLKDIKRDAPQWAKNRHETVKRFSKIVFGALTALCLIMILYNSIDLVLRDFVTCEVTYVESENGDFGNLTRLYTFETSGETIKIHSLREKDCKNYLLEKDEKYTVTYSKRTQMIVDVDGVEKVSSVEQPLKTESLYMMLIFTLFGIVGCVFGAWRMQYVEEKCVLLHNSGKKQV